MQRCDPAGTNRGRPVVVTTPKELKAIRGAAPGGRVALVPTLGALHAGHADLFDAARNQAQLVVASIFVNPLQFGPHEDFDRYPRDLDSDVELCAKHAVDLVFAPSLETMYPSGQPVVTVDPGPLGSTLEGAIRPDHFRGVLTVVTKLFNVVSPDVAVFGEKDFQQLVLVRRLVSDLSLDVHVVAVETRREPDGLALSSRNRYLTPIQRAAAGSLSRALRAGAGAAPAGRDAVLAAAQRVLEAEPRLHVDYVALRSGDLASAARVGAARLLVSARIGTTRLIDNAAVHLP